MDFSSINIFYRFILSSPYLFLQFSGFAKSFIQLQSENYYLQQDHVPWVKIQN